jgi:hypothetical protein
MPRIKVAHVKHDNIDLIIVPLDPSFGSRPLIDQQRTTGELQLRARSAGLAGTVVPVWDAGLGRMGYVAPQNWQPFFSSISLQWVWLNVNRELFW